MKHERITLSEERGVSLDTYILNSSPEIDNSSERPAIVVCPGGAYEYLSDREGEPIALAFAAQGFHAFVLNYSVKEHTVFPNPLIDISLAMKHIRDNAKEWGVISDNIAVCGFSAGGHLAASLGVHWNNEKIQRLSGCMNGENKPDALVLCYALVSSCYLGEPGQLASITKGIDDEAERAEAFEMCNVHNYVGEHTPPSYIMHTFFDAIVPVENSLVFAAALAKAEVPFELHVVQNGVHGLALANDVTMAGQPMIEPDVEPWVKSCGGWLKRLFSREIPSPVKWESGITRRR